MNVYDFTVKAMDGTDVSLRKYEGEVILIVNTATECGFTPQYKKLQSLYDEFHKKGLAILDFPCNQFANQAPNSNKEIHRFCTGRFGITFEQFAKIDVLGDNAIPLYKWISQNTSFGGFKWPMNLFLALSVKKMDRNYKNNGNIKWNFTKILIDRNGNIVKRFEPTDSFKRIRKSIQALL